MTAPEERNPLQDMHLPEGGGEFGLLVAAARYIEMRAHHLPPGFERAGLLRLDRLRRVTAVP